MESLQKCIHVNKESCKHEWRGVSYGNGPLLECIYCEDQKPFPQDAGNSIEMQQEHWLYKHAKELDKEAEIEQFKKAAVKYPEPLNPFSWTGPQLVAHGMQELFDSRNYLACMDILFKDYERRINEALEILENAFLMSDIQEAIEILKGAGQDAGSQGNK